MLPKRLPKRTHLEPLFRSFFVFLTLGLHMMSQGLPRHPPEPKMEPKRTLRSSNLLKKVSFRRVFTCFRASSAYFKPVFTCSRAAKAHILRVFVCFKPSRARFIRVFTCSRAPKGHRIRVFTLFFVLCCHECIYLAFSMHFH